MAKLDLAPPVGICEGLPRGAHQVAVTFLERPLGLLPGGEAPGAHDGGAVPGSAQRVPDGA